MRTVRPDIDAYGLQTNFLAMDLCNKHLDVLDEASVQLRRLMRRFRAILSASTSTYCSWIGLARPDLPTSLLSVGPRQ